jgi:hypothetical protein
MYNWLLRLYYTMLKIASTAIMAKTVFKEGYAFFSLILGICSIVFSELMISVGKLAFLLIWTASKLTKFFT